MRRSALPIAAAVLAAAVGGALAATGPGGTVGPNGCGGELRPGAKGGLWQVTNLPGNATDLAVDPERATRLVAIDATHVWLSDDDGCHWRTGLELTSAPGDEVTISSSTARFVGVAISNLHLVLVSVNDGGRTRIVNSLSGETGTWGEGSSGLPPVGAPGPITATFTANGQSTVAYMAIAPANVSSSDGGGGTVPIPGGPTVPPVVKTTNTPAMVYSTVDGGTWTQVSDTNLPAAVSDFAVDVTEGNLTYAVSGGSLLRSTNDGQTYTALNVPGTPVSVATRGPGGVQVFTTEGKVYVSTTKGASFTASAAPPNVLSSAWRKGDPALMAAVGGTVQHIDTTTGEALDVTPAGLKPTVVVADRTRAARYDAIAGSLFLRWSDLAPAPGKPIAQEDSDNEIPPPNKGTLTPAAQTVTLAPGESRTLPYLLSLPRNRTPVDLFIDFDISASLQRNLEALKSGARRLVTTLQAQGIDVRVGLGTIGSAPDSRCGADPALDPTRSDYKRPVLYSRVQPVGRPDADFFTALNAVALETSPAADPSRQCNRRHGALVSLEQLALGNGVNVVDPNVGLIQVAKGQQAGWRQRNDVRRLVVLATDDEFPTPPGTHVTASGENDFAYYIKLLKDQHVDVLGLDFDNAYADMVRITNGVGSVAPPGGVECINGYRLKQGDPLVCRQATDPADIISSVVDGFEDFAVLPIKAQADAGLVSIAAPGLDRVNVKQDEKVPFTVTYSCAGQSAGSHPAVLQVSLRDTVVGEATATVICQGGAPAKVVVPPKVKVPEKPTKVLPQVPGQQVPPPPPAPPAPAPAPAPAAAPAPAPAPAPAAQVQPQAQVQAQAQAQAQVQAAAREQQQLQLAVAFADFGEGPQSELAASRRSADDAAAAWMAGLALVGGASATGMMMRRRARAAIQLERVRR